MSQESHDGRYAAVYLCAELGGDASEGFSEIYHASAPPIATKGGSGEAASLTRIYENIRTLLDEDQGSFHEVYLCSLASRCLDCIESYASSMPTAVLIELVDTTNSSAPLLCAHGDCIEAYPFLRGLAADVAGSRYQQSVMPFALVPSASGKAEEPLGATLTENCLNAGAIDILHSPLGPEDLNRLVGHVEEITRPPARLLGARMAQNLVDSIGSETAFDTAKHRPDVCLSDSRKDFVETSIGHWMFPAQDLNMDELTYAALQMLERMLSVPELSPYRPTRAELVTFLLATRRQYKHERQVHYHNWRHAVDVTQSLFCFLLASGLCPRRHYDREARDATDVNALERLLTPLDGLMLLVSAIGHDVGHPGVNNAFLVASCHPLAQMYNDKSVLENYHCAAYSQLLRRSWPALSNLDGFRSTMISNILATDMQRHFEYMTQLSDLKRKIDASPADLHDWKPKDCEDTRLLLTALLMKAADISNVARPFDISRHWAQTLMTEFSRQAQLESELQIPTCLFGGPPKEGDELAAAQSQKGFMDLFGMPLFQGMTDVMPGMGCASSELRKNHELWQHRIESKTAHNDSHAEEHPLTFASVTESEVREAQKRHHNSEPTVVPIEVGQSISTSTIRRPVVDAANVPQMHPAARFNPSHSTLDRSTADEEVGDLAPLSLNRLISPPIGTSSRRSSKDVALEQYQQLTHAAAQAVAFGSGPLVKTTDGGWQVHQSYPGSRRGSKDENVTTILLTKQGTSIQGNTPSPFTTGARALQAQDRTSNDMQRPTKQHSAPASEFASSKLGTASDTAQYNADAGLGALSNGHSPEPHSASDNSLAYSDGDGTARPRPRTESRPETKPASPYIVTRVTSDGTEDADRTTSSGSQRDLKQSRSRSRLHNFKFWKRKRESPPIEYHHDR